MEDSGWALCFLSYLTLSLLAAFYDTLGRNPYSEVLF